MKNIGPLSAAEFKKFYSRVPRLCVEVIVKKSSGVLLTKRLIRPWKGFWHFPGGTVRYGESLEQAVARIGRGEIGLKVSIKKVLGPLEFFHSDEGQLHVVSLGCLVKVSGGAMKGGWQGEELKFFKRIPKKIIKEHARFLRAYKLIKI